MSETSAVGHISTRQPTICMEYLVYLAPDSEILLQVCSPWGLVLLQATGCKPNEHMTSRKAGGWLVLFTSLSALTGGELLHAGFISWCANAWQLVGWYAGAPGQETSRRLSNICRLDTMSFKYPIACCYDPDSLSQQPDVLCSTLSGCHIEAAVIKSIPPCKLSWQPWPDQQ